MAVIAQLGKLRGKSFEEISERGRQELAKLTERVLGRGACEMSDADFQSEIVPGSRGRSAEATATFILNRLGLSVPLATPMNKAGLLEEHKYAICELIKQRYPSEESALMELADRSTRGSFDLLGFDNLQFGQPIDWHLEPISEKRAPLIHWSKIDYLEPDLVGDKKIIWELNRHQHFVTLGQAYWMSGEERYAQAFVSQATSWMESNPPNIGINWVSSLELALRSISWLWALRLFAGSAQITPPFIVRMLKHLLAHGSHIESYLSHYFSPNTHLTGEALGLFYLGCALPAFRVSEAWLKRGMRILLDQLPKHVRRDGVYFEQTSYYQRYTADFYIHLLLLGRPFLGWDRIPGVEKKLSRLLDHLMWITRPDGTSPLLGDDDGGRLIKLGHRRSDDFRDTLAIGAALLERSDWKKVAGEAPVDLLWLLGAEGVAAYDNLAAQAPATRSRAFLDGGYFVVRDRWEPDSDYLLIDCGPHGDVGCGHAHADALSFEFAHAGMPFLIDPGTFTYTGDRSAREKFRASSSHNTATVDGESQSAPAAPFSWKSIARSALKQFVADDSFAYLEGSHDGYERLDDPVTHTRAFLFVPQNADLGAESYIVIRDSFAATRRHAYSLWFHFSPECLVSKNGDRLCAVSRSSAASDPAKLEIAVFGGTPRLSIGDGWVSRCYGHRQLAPVASVEDEATGPLQFVSFLLPHSFTKQTGPRVRREHDGGFEIDSGEFIDVLALGEPLFESVCGPISARASLAWARMAAGRTESALLIDGDRIDTADGLSLRAAAPMRWCAIHRSRGELRVDARDAEQFELSFEDKVDRIRVDNTVLDVASSRRRVNVVRRGSNWTLS